MAKRPNLREYERKRDFSVTPEPGPDASARQTADARPTFMVHKHDATRLHYDLRLEMDGALASWAIPKGPSYDPAQKRLAVQTEDHPLEYGNFEGRIPDGEYGAGDSIIWDRGHYETFPPGQAGAMRKKGHLVVELDGEKLKGRWHLVRTPNRGGKEQWLCFKAKDGAENPAYDVVADRPESVVSGRRITRGPVRAAALRAVHPSADRLLDRVWPPMAAQLSTPEAAPAGQFRYEVKYDGYRGIAAVSGGQVAMRTRNGLDLLGRFPAVGKALSRLVVGEAVLDGEVVALDPKGVSRMALLGSDTAEERFVVFDLLWLDGQDLRERPVEERRELLESVMANVPPPLDLAEVVRVEDVAQAMELARRRGLEGLIAKRLGSPYQGKRSADWLKLKVNASQELVIVGFTPIKNGKKQIGALLVGVHDQGEFRYAGKVGTGYSAKLRAELFRTLSADRAEKAAVVDAPRMRDAVWVKPRRVAQVEFTEWTADGKLRHPAFVALREDKRPEDCVRERPQSPPRAGRKAAPRRRAAAKSTQARASPAPAAPAVEVKPTSTDRVMFPRSGITKGEIFAYYQTVAEPMANALHLRPLALQQWPQGIHKPGFFRQEVKGAPAWAKVVRVPSEERDLDKLLVDRPETILWLANQSALTLHMWSSRLPHLDEPDWVVFDLDPGEGTWADLIRVATTLRGMLEHLGLASFPKTSGKRGLHVFVPMARGHTHQDAVDFAVALTTTLEKGLGDIATTERSKAARRGRLYLDAFQNGKGKTVVAPYSVRAIEGAPVSAPLRWSEVGPKLDPSAFTVRTMPRRLAQLGDLFAPVLTTNQRLPRFR